MFIRNIRFWIPRLLFRQIAEKAAKFRMPAVALTDHGNMFGAIDFYKACKDVKVKPL